MIKIKYEAGKTAEMIKRVVEYELFYLQHHPADLIDIEIAEAALKFSEELVNEVYKNKKGGED